MFKKSLCLLLVFVFGVMSSGCATITRGDRQLVSIASNPSGAQVKIDGLKGTTPYSASLARNKDYVVEVSKDGYETEQKQIIHSFGALTIWGNLPWLLIGVIVDFCSGAAFKLDPTNVDVELEQKKA